MILLNLHYFADACAQSTFFGIPAWHKYLVLADLMKETPLGTCELIPGLDPSDWARIIALIGLAVLDMLLRVAGLVAVAYIIFGGVRFVTSTGLPDKTKEAQESIINALIGLVIAVIAVSFVTFLGNRIGK